MAKIIYGSFQKLTKSETQELKKILEYKHICEFKQLRDEYYKKKYGVCEND